MTAPALAQQPESDPIAEAVELSRQDPEWFLENILRATDRDPWQTHLVEAINDVFNKRDGLPTKRNHEGKNRFTIRSGHGPGKTTTAAMIAHFVNFTHVAQIVCTATKYKQITTRLWPRFRMLRAGAIDEYQLLMNVKGEKITWANDPDWCMWAETATQPENLQGVHPNGSDDWVVFIVDEASGVNEVLFQVIQGALATGRAILILIGNPTQNVGEFYASFNKKIVAEMYYQVHVRPEDSSHMDPKEGERYIRRYGLNSPVTKVRWLGEFAETAQNQLIPHSHLMAALSRPLVDDGSISRLRIAVDVADGGDDETILDAARLYETHTNFLKQERHSFPSSESPVLAADAAIRLFNALGGRKEEDEFVVDSLGVGAGTAGTLMARGYRVICYKGGEASDNPNAWRCRRVQSYIALRDELAAARVSFAEDYALEDQDIDDMVDQCCAIRARPGTERVEDIEPKKDHVARTQKSPDLADTKAMMFATKLPSTGSTMLLNPTITAVGMMESADASW